MNDHPFRTVLRIAHISDIHIGRRPALGELNVKRLLGYANFALFRSRKHDEQVARQALERLTRSPPDLLLLTGDISQHGLDSEFLAARALFSGLMGQGVPILATAGNHDFYGGGYPETLKQLKEDLALGQSADQFGIHRFGVVEILTLEQGVVSPPFFAYGRLEPEALDRAAETWGEKPEGVTRLICGHFPLLNRNGGIPAWFRGLENWRKLSNFIARCGVSAYFCGHDHRRFSAELEGGCIQYSAPPLSVAGRTDIYECDEDGVEFIGTL